MNKTIWTKTSYQRWLRIKLLVAAYCYEFEPDKIFMDDAAFDYLSNQVDLSVNTDNEIMDNWFRENFKPNTGMWIHKLPKEEVTKLLDVLSKLGKVYYEA